MVTIYFLTDDKNNHSFHVFTYVLKRQSSAVKREKKPQNIAVYTAEILVAPRGGIVTYKSRIHDLCSANFSSK